MGLCRYQKEASKARRRRAEARWRRQLEVKRTIERIQLEVETELASRIQAARKAVRR